VMRSLGQAGKYRRRINWPYADQQRDENRPKLKRDMHGVNSGALTDNGTGNAGGAGAS